MIPTNVSLLVFTLSIIILQKFATTFASIRTEIKQSKINKSIKLGEDDDGKKFDQTTMDTAIESSEKRNQSIFRKNGKYKNVIVPKWFKEGSNSTNQMKSEKEKTSNPDLVKFSAFCNWRSNWFSCSNKITNAGCPCYYPAVTAAPIIYYQQQAVTPSSFVSYQHSYRQPQTQYVYQPSNVACTTRS